MSPVASSSRPQVTVRKAGEQLQYLPRLRSGRAQPTRAGHCLRDVRDDAVAPATDLVPEVPRAAEPGQADRTLPHDAAVGFLVAPHRRHLDHEPVVAEAHLERGVIEVEWNPVLVARHDRLEEAAVPTDAV